MKTRIQKWGNSLALRIPKYIAEEAGLYKDGSVELTLLEGRMLVTPEPSEVPALEQLIAGMNAENLHYEVDSGKPAGNEVW